MDRRKKRASKAVMSIFLDSLGGVIDNVDVAEFDSDGSDLKALIVGIEPVQSGTGDPSPDNNRPITGHSSVNVIVSPTLNPLDGTITNIPLGGTYYQGLLDVITGLLTITHEKITRTVCGGVSTTNAGCFYILSSNPIVKLPGLVKSNYLLTANAGGNTPLQPFFSATQAGGAATTIWCRLDDTYITKSDVDTYLTSNPLELLYQLDTPQTIQLTGQQISTFLGTNHVWCDSGKIIHLEY